MPKTVIQFLIERALQIKFSFLCLTRSAYFLSFYKDKCLSTLFSLIYSNAIHKIVSIQRTYPFDFILCFSQIGSVLSNYLVLPFLGIYCHKINVTSVINGYHSLLLIEIMVYIELITYELGYILSTIFSTLRYFIGYITFNLLKNTQHLQVIIVKFFLKGRSSVYRFCRKIQESFLYSLV